MQLKQKPDEGRYLDKDKEARQEQVRLVAWRWGVGVPLEGSVQPSCACPGAANAYPATCHRP
jgi:hypothetical protein